MNFSSYAFLPILVLICTPSCLKNRSSGFKLTGSVISICSRIVWYLISIVSYSLGVNGFLTDLEIGKIAAGLVDCLVVLAPYPNIGRFVQLL